MPQPQPASTARSLLDHAEVEYAGAAAESPKKRPLLRIWAEEESDEAAFGTPEDEARPAAITVVSEASPPAQRRARRAAAGPVPAAHEGPELEGYRRALDLLRTGRHDEAVAAFRAFVRKHPQHDYADNAQYWLGECFYDRQDYPAALREFRRVVEQFPTGNKAPDALLKVAFSHLALGQDRPGRIALTEIVRNHPRHSAAGLAAAKLAELDGIGATAAATRKQEEVP